MTNEQRLKNLQLPGQPVDVILDTDAYNEVDDQYAISYLLANTEKLRLQAFYAAPFYKPHLESVKQGMEESYREICDLLKLAGREATVFKGSDRFMTDEKVPVDSDAARDLASRALRYSPESPLYVIAIGAITNIASAILLEPKVAENTVVVWLGGHAHHYHDTAEYNMRQDIPAARVVMGSGVPFVQLPCNGVVSSFRVSKPELEHWFVGKSALMSYLAGYTIKTAESYAAGKPWTRVIWDVTAVAWLLNEEDRFMNCRIEKMRLPNYEGTYDEPIDLPVNYVYHIKRDALMEDLIEKIASLK
jgi:inosine-uridine nucleoside N-ribohydrolase